MSGDPEFVDTDEERQAEDRGANRLRTVLAVVLVLLVLLLIGLSFFVVRVLAPAGRPTADEVPEGLQWMFSLYGFGPTDFEQVIAPNDTAIGPDGTIWVLDGQRGRVLAFQPDGDYANRKIDTGRPAPGAGKLYAPSGLDTDEDGNVYVADYGNNAVLVFRPDGGYIREWEVPLPLDVDVTGDRIAVSTRSGIALFTREIEIMGLVGTWGSGPEEFDMPRGVVQDDEGNLYVADTQNRRVKAYSADGELAWIFPESHRDASAIPTQAGSSEPFQIPSGMTMDGSGRLVLMDPFNLQVIVLDPQREGAEVGRYGEHGTEDGRFFYPTGISYDPARDWFAVADTSNDRAQVVRIVGSGGGLPGVARRAFEGPVRLCAIPLILLLLAIAIAVLRRRARERSDEAPAEDDGAGSPQDEVPSDDVLPGNG